MFKDKTSQVFETCEVFSTTLSKFKIVKIRKTYKYSI